MYHCDISIVNIMYDLTAIVNFTSTTKITLKAVVYKIQHFYIVDRQLAA